MEAAESQADREAKQQGIRGQAITPFLLQQVNKLTGGRALKANEALLVNNAKLAARIAKAFAQGLGRIV
jgi:pseudouridine-5'-phosphate glycosidase